VLNHRRAEAASVLCNRSRFAPTPSQISDAPEAGREDPTAVPTQQPKHLRLLADSQRLRLPLGVITQGMVKMPQVQTAEISPTTKREWDEVEIEFRDRAIFCVDCGQEFIWTAGEQLFFHDKGLRNEPKRCKPCKHAKNERLAAIAAAQATGVRQRIEVTVQCASCGQQTTVPFYPSQGRPVYCRACYVVHRNLDDDYYND